MPATWIVNPGNIAGRDSRTVNPTPGVNGTLYTLTPQALEGYDYPPQITNNKTGAGSSMLLVAGEQGAFSVTYIRSFDYTLTNSGVSPSPIIKGGTGHNSYGSVTITKTKNSGAADAVNLSVSGVPAGVTIDMPGGGNCAPNPTCDNIINFTVSSNAAVGTHPITVTGTASTAPGQKTTTFNLVIDKSPDIVISSCSGSPNPAVLGQQAVTWTASGISGGTGTGYTFTWTGSGIPTSPAPTTNPYTVTYTTTGAKVATFHVLDSNGNAGTCTPAPVQVNFDPNSREI
jgi:hypothetical protein